MKKLLYKFFLNLLAILPIASISFAANSKKMEMCNQDNKEKLFDSTQGIHTHLYLNKKIRKAWKTLLKPYQNKISIDELFIKVSSENPKFNENEVNEIINESINILLQNNLITIEENLITSAAPSLGGGSGSSGGG